MRLLLRWQSIHPEENRYRCYSLSVGPDLWGQPCVIRRWGRLWGGASEQFTWVSSEDELLDLIRETQLSRSRHGYRLIGTF
ncbi:MAG TPA: hypothetical protein ENI60_03330 [Candidatus Fraserbacteria bacterium]|nr:hypothetical protein [Candidatus Fraserbacteria bacterium]